MRSMLKKVLETKLGSQKNWLFFQRVVWTNEENRNFHFRSVAGTFNFFKLFKKYT